MPGQTARPWKQQEVGASLTLLDLPRSLTPRCVNGFPMGSVLLVARVPGVPGRCVRTYRTWALARMDAVALASLGIITSLRGRLRLVAPVPAANSATGGRVS